MLAYKHGKKLQGHVAPKAHVRNLRPMFLLNIMRPTFSNSRPAFLDQNMRPMLTNARPAFPIPKNKLVSTVRVA